MGRHNKRQVLIRGRHLYLSTVAFDDLVPFAHWYHDPRVYGHLRDMSLQSSFEDYLEWMKLTLQDGQQRVFSLCYLPEDKLIGNLGFKYIDFENKSAEMWWVIGEPDYWGRGLGSEAYLLLARYGFSQMGFHSLFAEHNVSNPASLKNALKGGARLLGTRRRCKWIRGQWIDADYTDLLPEDLRWDRL